MQKITPFLWFDNQAEEAVNFYISVFKASKITKVNYYTQAGADVSGMPKQSVMTIAFQLNELEFIALNGGPQFSFSPAISFVINCKAQEEVDHYWEKLSQEGTIEQCGWLKDKYGISWQVVPTLLGELLSDSDPAKVQKVMQAMLQMKKLDIQALKHAYEQ